MRTLEEFLPASPDSFAPATAVGGWGDAAVRALAERRVTLDRALADLGTARGELGEAAGRLIVTLRGGGKVLVAGNGGSAAEAQHFAAELVGRFKREREPYAVLALCTDSAILTAVANDYGYAEVFARQIRALGGAGDLLLAFSTSGESENLVRAAAAGRERGMSIVVITGERASRLACAADLAIRVPAADTAVAQELHTIVTHVLCDIVEASLSNAERGTWNAE